MSDLWRDSLDLQGRPAPAVLWTLAAPSGDLPALRRWRAAVGPVRVGDAAPGCTGRWPLTVAAWNTNVGGGAIRALWDHLTAGEGALGRGTESERPAARPTVLLLQEAFATGPGIPTTRPGTATGPEIPATGPGTAAKPEIPATRPCAATRPDTPPPTAGRWAKRIAAVPPGGQRTDIVSFAREVGLSLFYVPSMRNGAPAADPPEDRGNAILANVPLSSQRAIELPLERQRRVAVAAEVLIADTPVALCSVHLENRSPWSRAWRTLGAARRHQMARLLDVEGFAPRGPAAAEARAHVLGGDLNTWVGGRREGAYRLARECFTHPEQPDPQPTHHFEIGGWLRHSDHLMFRLPPGWHGDCRRLDDIFGSDHYPLVGTLAPKP